MFVYQCLRLTWVTNDGACMMNISQHCLHRIEPQREFTAMEHTIKLSPIHNKY